MKMLSLLCTFAFSFFGWNIWGQTNFRAGWEKNNPIAPESTLTLEEKVSVHQNILHKATINADTLQQLYGLLYLFYDYLRTHDYLNAARYLLEAEKIANASGNPGWQGWVMHRKGALAVHLKKYEEAILPYEASLALCSKAKDSLCMGESLEQLSSMYAEVDSYEKAHDYYNLALPLVEKFGSAIQLATTLNNYANLLAVQGDPDKAIPVLERALLNIRKAGDKQREAKYLNNIADAYRQLRRYDDALKEFNRCVQINLENNWPENLMDNYSGLSKVYETKGNFQLALNFFRQSQELQDSIIGIEIRETITNLETKYQRQQKELELRDNQIALDVAQSRLQLGAMIFLGVLSLTAYGLCRWRIEARQAARDQLQNQENLAALTQILLKKNSLISELETQAVARSSGKSTLPGAADFEENLYNQRILTEEDWSAFKVYFEKVYPGYLQRLRTTFSALSGAEERLFLFVKLNLTTKEAATILGISADSVKKTRYRLRKRLELDEATDLDTYIRNF